MKIQSRKHIPVCNHLTRLSLIGCMKTTAVEQLMALLIPFCKEMLVECCRGFAVVSLCLLVCFRYWMNNEPNNAGFNYENCAEVQVGPVISNWNDNQCSRELYGLCEKKIRCSTQ